MNKESRKAGTFGSALLNKESRKAGGVFLKYKRPRKFLLSYFPYSTNRPFLLSYFPYSTNRPFPLSFVHKPTFPTFLLSLFLVTSLPAAFTPVEDFETYTTGELTNQGPWLGDAGYLSVVEESGNKVARFNAPNSSGSFQLAYRNDALPTPESATTTLFFRMQLPAYTKTTGTTAVNIVALRNGNLNGGGDFTDNRHQMSFEQADGLATVNPALNYRDGSVNTFGTAIDTGQWCSIWIVMTRGAGSSGSWSLYMRPGSGDWQTGDFAVSRVAFRNTATVTDFVDLALFNPANNTVNVGALVDDFHYDETGANLTSPLSEPFGFSNFMEHFYPGETDPLVVGESADPDRDGRINSWEFRFGTPPDDPTNPGAPTMEVVDGIAILSFQKLRSVPAISYSVEWSETLQADSWADLILNPVVTGPGLLLPDHFDTVEAYVQVGD